MILDFLLLIAFIMIGAVVWNRLADWYNKRRNH